VRSAEVMLMGKVADAFNAMLAADVRHFDAPFLRCL
jgi:hypothetical protein